MVFFVIIPSTNTTRGMDIMNFLRKGQYIPKKDDVLPRSKNEFFASVEFNPFPPICYYVDIKVNSYLSVLLENAMRRTIFCSCGTTTHHREECSSCGKKAEISLKLPLDLKKKEKETETRHTVSYFYPHSENRNGCYVFTPTKLKLSLDKETGTVYLNGSPAKVSERSISYSYFHEHRHFMRNIRNPYFQLGEPCRLSDIPSFQFHNEPCNLSNERIHPRVFLEKSFGTNKGVKTFMFTEKSIASLQNVPKNVLIDFFKQSFERRGVLYKKPEQYIDLYDELKSGLESGLNLLKFPNLQHLPFDRLEYIPISLEYLLEEYKGEELYSKLFHNPSKKVRRLIHQNEYNANIQMIFGKYIKNPDNQLKLLKEEKPELHTMYSRVLWKLTNSKLFGFYENIDMYLLEKGIHYLQSLSDENTFVNRLISSFGELDSSVLTYIADIGGISENVLSHVPTYQARNKTNFKELHDELTRISRRFADGNRKIFLTEKEKSLSLKTDNYEFYLPTETYELVECGEDLDICVGDYSNRAANKNCTIMFFRINGKNIVCMELKERHEKLSIVQAKLKRNSPVSTNTKLNNLIIKHLEKNDVDIQTTDLRTNYSYSHGFLSFNENFNEGFNALPIRLPR